jgi:hypothetical protein
VLVDIIVVCNWSVVTPPETVPNIFPDASTTGLLLTEKTTLLLVPIITPLPVIFIFPATSNA